MWALWRSACAKPKREIDSEVVSSRPVTTPAAVGSTAIGSPNGSPEGAPGGGRADTPSLELVKRAARRASTRLFLNRFAERFVAASPYPLLASVGALAFVKVAAPEPRVVAWLGAFVVGGFLAVTALSWSRARKHARPYEGALALDRHHALEDRLTTALEFEAVEPPADARSAALTRLAVTDALEHLPKLDPVGAVPLQSPRGSRAAWVLAAGLGALALVEVRQREPVVVAPPPPVQTTLLLEDDVELLREMARELVPETTTPEAQAAVQRFNQLVEDVAARRLDREEAFRRIEALERALSGSALEAEALEEGLREMARELQRSSLSRPAAQALEEARLGDAKQALRELAERLKQKSAPPSRAELDELRKSLERASQESKKQQQATEAERASLEAERKRLLEKKAANTATPAEQEQLARTERRLEQLGRRQKRQEQAAAELSELDKQLAEAARELMKEQGRSSEFMEQSAQALEKLEQKQQSKKEKEELLKRLREMRDLLRQQKAQGGGQDQDYAERLQRLRERARGGKPGSKGEGKPGGQPGGARPSPAGQGVALGADGKPLPMAGSGQAPGEGAGKQPGTGRAPGDAHDPSVAGEQPSAAASETQDVAAVAADTGQGTASSESIYGAAERGFSSPDYKRIYTDYKTVAEDVIERESVPPGYRFYVRRYFQLIRPRE